MKETYSKWIQENVKGDGYGQCLTVTQKMTEAFPNLKRIRGHYYCFVWGERGHWWLVDENNEIIDPTVTQFPSKGVGHYEPWQEGTREPTGMCPNCSEYCYNGDTCCSERCHDAYAAYCMNPY